MRSCLRRLAICAVVAVAPDVGLLAVTDAVADMFYNSSEPGCNGSNPDILWCDDFEDGVGWVTDGDHGGESDPVNDGWSGGINETDTYGDGDWVLCGSYGVAGTNCAAHKGNQGAVGFEAWHRLNTSGVKEIYFRWYQWIAPGSSQLQEKLLGLGGASGFTNTNSDYGWLEIRFTNGIMGLNQNDPVFETAWLGHNVSPFPYVQGRWLYVEIRFKNETTPTSSDGEFQMWADDCGANGLGCTGSGTLRSSFTGLDWNRSGISSTNINWLFVTTWSNTGNTGLRKYDQIVVSKRRIGPMGSVSPPPPLSAPAAPMLLQ